MEKSAKLHCINLVFIPRDCDVAPKQKFPFNPQTKYPPPLVPQTKHPRTATAA